MDMRYCAGQEKEKVAKPLPYRGGKTVGNEQSFLEVPEAPKS